MRVVLNSSSSSSVVCFTAAGSPGTQALTLTSKHLVFPQPAEALCALSHGRRGGSGGRGCPASGGYRAGLGRRRRDRGPHRCQPGRGQNRRRRQLGRHAPHRPRRSPSGRGRQGASTRPLGAAGRVRRGARAAPGRRDSLGAHLRAALEGALSPPLHYSAPCLCVSLLTAGRAAPSARAARRSVGPPTAVSCVNTIRSH